MTKINGLQSNWGHIHKIIQICCNIPRRLHIFKLLLTCQQQDSKFWWTLFLVCRSISATVFHPVRSMWRPFDCLTCSDWQLWLELLIFVSLNGGQRWYWCNELKRLVITIRSCLKLSISLLSYGSRVIT